MIMGDFNVPLVGSSQELSSSKCNDLATFYEGLKLKSYNSIKNKDGNTLDLILANNDGVEVCAGISIEDGIFPILESFLDTSFTPIQKNLRQ